MLRSPLLKSITTALVLYLASSVIVHAKEPLPVVASFSILGDLVKEIGGEHVSLTTLVGANGDAHVYQPTPADARAVSSAKVLFVNGLEFEGWIDRLVSASGFKGVKIISTRGIEAIPFAEEEGHGEGHGDGAFEWAGIFNLAAGSYKWSFAKVDGKYADPAMKMVIIASGDIEKSEKSAERLLLAKSSETRLHNDRLVAKDIAYKLTFDDAKSTTVFTVNIKKDGKYAFFTEHMPFEFEADEHFLKDLAGKDVEPIAQEPDTGHHHHHGTYDPHAWQSAENIVIYADNIAAALAKADPENASSYSTNRTKFVSKVRKLDVEIMERIKAIPEDARTVVTSHDAFGYFSKRYGIKFEAPQGLSTESEASAKDVAKLIKQIRDEKISAVFVETITDNRLIQQIARETGAKVGGTLYSDALSGPEGPAASYLKMMRYNSSKIFNALK